MFKRLSLNYGVALSLIFLLISIVTPFQRSFAEVYDTCSDATGAIHLNGIISNSNDISNYDDDFLSQIKATKQEFGKDKKIKLKHLQYMFRHNDHLNPEITIYRMEYYNISPEDYDKNYHSISATDANGQKVMIKKIPQIERQLAYIICHNEIIELEDIGFDETTTDSRMIIGEPIELITID